MNSKVAVDTQIMRGINAAAVVTLLRGVDRMSVSELSASSGLSRQAVSRALSGLSAVGFVEYSAPDANETRSGRPAQLVRFRADAGHIIGIAVSTREIRLAIADLRGDTVSSIVVPLDSRPVVHVLREAIRDLLASAKLQADDIWSASIGAPGIVDTDAGVIKLIPSMEELQGDTLVRCVSDALNCAIYLDNDVKLATVGEQWRGATGELSSLVLIEWGERVGAGVLINGVLHRGASNDAGDIGFLDIAVDDPAIAERPGLGAFENWVGGSEIVSLTRVIAEEAGDTELLDHLHDRTEPEALEIVISAVLDSRPTAVEAVTRIARRLVSGIAVVRALIDPELVIIGGPMARCGDLLLQTMSQALSEQVLNQPALELSSLGDDAVLYGAVHHSLNDVDERFLASHALTDSLSPHARA